jgi:uncharacterized protein (DUF1697 family)
MLEARDTMTRYVAFLRAINVGGHTVRMDALRRLFEAWGGANVETFIASGNVIFETSRRNQEVAERAIEEHVRKALGYPVVTFLRTVPELAAIAAHAPYPQAEFDSGGALFVGFMKSAPSPAVARAVAALRNDVNDFTIKDRELYWLRRSQLMQSLATGPPLERLIGSPMTMRNVNTVHRLARKYCG